MVKRQLTQEEKDMIIKNVKFLREETEYKEALIKEKKVLIEIAPLKYQHQLSTMQQELKLLETEASEYRQALADVDKQLTEGVEIKAKKKK